MTSILVHIIQLYQILVSPLLPPGSCRFYPSCSQYAIDAVHKHGPLKGVWYAIIRVGKCHPFHPGGNDPA